MPRCRSRQAQADPAGPPPGGPGGMALRTREQLAEIAGVEVGSTTSTPDGLPAAESDVAGDGEPASVAQPTPSPAINSSPIRSTLASMGASFAPIIEDLLGPVTAAPNDSRP
mgnify:CR=1 FL=1